MTTTTTIATVVDTYIAAWNEPDPERRRALVGAVWSDGGSYLDPLMAGHGADEIAGMIGAAQAQFPGHRFELSSGPDAHHDVGRFAWTLRGADGPAAHGVDFATVAGDGRLREVTGFLESA
jgi:hypothetical protein